MITAETSTLEADWEQLPFMPDPYPFFARLRAEQPVFRTPAGFWYVTTYDLVNTIFRKPKLFSSDITNAAAPDPYIADPKEGLWSRVFKAIIMMQDGDAHRRLRQLAQPIFSPRAIESFRDGVKAAISRQLDLALEATKTNELDLIADFTLPLPTNIILDMFGFPNSEAYRFYEATDIIVPPVARAEPAEWLAHADAVYASHWDFIVDGANERRANPGDDLLSHIATAGDEDTKLTDLELVAFVTFLVTAGYETTANTIASGIYSLLKHPDEMKKLRANPALFPLAVEETLRFEAATRNGGMRYVTEDVVLGNQQLRQGDSILTCITAANHDPAAFEDPDRFDISRQPNPHLAFAAGPHACLGLALARIEIEEGLRLILERFPNLQLAYEPEWKPSFIIRGLQSLPVTW